MNLQEAIRAAKEDPKNDVARPNAHDQGLRLCYVDGTPVQAEDVVVMLRKADGACVRVLYVDDMLADDWAVWV